MTFIIILYNRRVTKVYNFVEIDSLTLFWPPNFAYVLRSTQSFHEYSETIV